MKTIAATLVILASAFAFAQTTPTGTAAGAPNGNGAAMMGHHTPPPQCVAPLQACEAAGFKVGAHHKGDAEGADKGAWVDCIDAVADGKKTVNGVTAQAAQACRAAHKAMKHGGATTH